MKTGRNNYCPCGSGLKYKKCCSKGVTSLQILDQIHKAIARQMQEELKKKNTYGQVMPIISTEFNKHRFVAVGNGAHFSNRWRNFIDFLLDYIKHSFGSGWWNKELDRPLSEHHEVMHWYKHLCDWQKTQHPNEFGLYPFPQDGTGNAYLLLSYDLYILKHHGVLQKEILRRLRLPDLFRGARYELFVAAAFIRAGFEIQHEDETHSPEKIPDYLGEHKATSIMISIEAKAKHRVPADFNGVHLKIQNLLNDAAKKKRRHPFVLCVELALPPENSSNPPSWIVQVNEELSQFLTANGGRNPFDLIVFTNVPHQYGVPRENDPAKHYYAIWPNNSAIPEDLIMAIGEAFRQYGNVPDEFPKDYCD